MLEERSSTTAYDCESAVTSECSDFSHREGSTQRDVKEAEKVPAKIEPVVASVSKVAPPPTPVSERRAPVASTSPVRPAPAKAGQKKSFVLPIAVVAIVAILLFALPKLFRQQSDAATSPAKEGSETTPAT